MGERRRWREELIKDKNKDTLQAVRRVCEKQEFRARERKEKKFKRASKRASEREGGRETERAPWGKKLTRNSSLNDPSFQQKRRERGLALHRSYFQDTLML